MIFTQPIPFADAVKYVRRKQLLPTNLSSEQLMTIAPDLRERALFSARVENANILQGIQDRVEQLVTGLSPGPGQYSNPATERLEMKNLLDELDYRPAVGDEGTIKDLRTDRRLNLILDTQEKMATGYGQYLQSTDADIVDLWPCWELVRVEDRKEKRNWQERWVRAGGRLSGAGHDRMIARKDDGIWQRISAFGLPQPPFDFGSGMGVEDVDRDTAIELGVIRPSDRVQPERREFNEDLQMSSEVRDQALRAALMADVGDQAQFVGDTLTWKN